MKYQSVLSEIIFNGLKCDSMPESYAWLTLVCVLCVLNVGWCRAADDDEHVHIKVRMPELVRKHKTHKPPQQHSRHKYHQHHHLPHQHYHNPYKSYHQQPHLPAQYSPATHQAVKHSRRAVKSTPPLPPPPAPYPPMKMTHNHLDTGPHGDEFHAGDMPDHLLYSPDAPQPMPIANYGPALFGSIDGETGGTAADGDSDNGNKQQSHLTASMLTMPGGTQQLMQHMELMSALAAAAAAAAGGGAGGVSNEEDDAGGGGAGVGISETNTLLADDFLADLQRTYANGKYPPTTHLRSKKRYRGVGLVGETDDVTAAFPLIMPQQKQQQQKLQLMRQQQQQQFHGVNYFMPPMARPQAQMLRPPLASSNSNYNNNYNYYQQLAQYKSKKQHHYNSNNNDIYTTVASDEDNEGYADDEPNDGINSYNNNDNNEDEDDSHDTDDNVSLFFSNRPTTSTLSSTAAAATAAAFSSNDYDDNDGIEFTYNSNNNKNYKHNHFEAVDEGVNPVSFQPTTGYGAAAFAASQPTSATAVTRYKMRPYRQLQQHRYTSQQNPFGILGQQQQQLVTTTQPINVIGPTANDFDDQQQQQLHQHHHHQEQLPPPPPPSPTAQQQQHKFTVSPATRYKKRKNRIKTKANRNRILTH